ncbi:MAG: phage tail tape measure protein [Actinomycetes bacterium]
MSVIVSILTTYNGAGAKRAMRDLGLMQKQATLAGQGMTASMLAASAGMQRAGAGMATAGTKMSKFVTLPVVAVGAVSLVAAAKFESSMKLIKTQAGGTQKDVEYLSAAVLKLGSNSKHGPEELATALYHLKSVGLDNVTAIDALTQSERLASVGHSDLEATTNAVAGAYKSGIKGAQDFSEAAGNLNAIIGAGNMRMEDLVSAMGTGFLVNAQQFGLSLTDVGSALAMMTSRGIPATRAAGALKMAFAGLAAPSAKAEKIMKGLGFSSEDLAVTMREKGLLPALELLKSKLAGLSKTDQTIALTQMFGAKSSQAILTLLANLKDYDKTQQQVADNAGKFDELVGSDSASTSGKWKQFKAAMQSVSIQIGNVLLPTALKLATALGKLAAWLNNMSPGTRKWVVQIALLAAVVGPVLIAMGKLIVACGRVVGAVAKVSLAMGKGAAAAPRWARGIAGATKGAVTGIKNLAAGFRSSQAAESAFTGRMGTLGGKIKKALASLTSGAAPKKLAASFKRLGSTIASNVAAGFTASSGKLKTLIQAGAQKAASGVKLAISTVTSVAASAAGVVKDTAATVANTAAKVANAVATKVVAAAQWLWNAALTANPIGLIIVAIAAVVAIFIVLWKKCKWFRDFWKAVWGEIVTVAKAVWGWLKPGLDLIWQGIKIVWDKVWAATQWVWERIGPYVVKYVKLLWEGLKFWFGVIKAVVTKVWDGLEVVTRKAWPVVLFIVRGVVANIKIAVAVLKVVYGIVKAAWEGIVAVTRTVWNAAKVVVVAAIKGIVTTVDLINRVRDVIRRAWQKVADITGTIWNALKGVVADAMDWMYEKILAVWQKIKGVYDSIKGWFGGGSKGRAGKGGPGPRSRAGQQGMRYSLGGYVPPTPGGVAALLAEAGEGEYIVPESRAGRFARGVLGQNAASGGTTTVVKNYFKAEFSFPSMTGTPTAAERRRVISWMKPELERMWALDGRTDL